MKAIIIFFLQLIIIQMAEKSTLNLLSLQKNIQQSLKKPQAKQACLSFEYKLLLLYSAQFGVYIMPQLDTLDVWHGIVFVRYGIFKDGKFKFKITFDDFPKKSPKVTFMSDIYHPMIDPETSQLDLGEEIEKNWNYGSDHLVFSVIQHIRLVFIDVKKYQIGDSYNKKAADLFKNNVDEFFIKVRQCVESSKNQIYQNYSESSLKFLPFNEKHKKIKDQLSQICEDQTMTSEEKKKKFLKALKD